MGNNQDKVFESLQDALVILKKLIKQGKENNSYYTELTQVYYLLIESLMSFVTGHIDVFKDMQRRCEEIYNLVEKNKPELERQGLSIFYKDFIDIYSKYDVSRITKLGQAMNKEEISSEKSNGSNESSNLESTVNTEDNKHLKSSQNRSNTNVVQKQKIYFFAPESNGKFKNINNPKKNEEAQDKVFEFELNDKGDEASVGIVSDDKVQKMVIEAYDSYLKKVSVGNYSPSAKKIKVEKPGVFVLRNGYWELKDNESKIVLKYI